MTAAAMTTAWQGAAAALAGRSVSEAVGQPAALFVKGYALILIRMWVRRRRFPAGLHNIVPTREGARWWPHEDLFLREVWRTPVPTAVIAAALRRSPQACRNQAHRLGLARGRAAAGA